MKTKMFLNLACGCTVNRFKNHSIDLSTMPTDATCKSLYLEGFAYIGIRDEAIEWLKTLKKEQLEFLIETKKTQKKTDEVKILEKVITDFFKDKKKEVVKKVEK